MQFSKPAGLILNFIWTILLSANIVRAQAGFKIFLVGDAGDHEDAGETLTNLQKELNKNPSSAVVFLGDNSYKDILGGIIPFGFKGFDSSANTMNKIRSQLALLENYRGFAYFIPGNHDWWNRSTYEKGKNKLAMEESFIEQNLKTNTAIANPGNNFLPRHGDYGPDYVELNDKTLRLIFLDTYRIVQTGIKKSKIPEEENSFYKRLDSVIRAGYELKEKIIVVAHHPVYAAGPYTRRLKHPYLFARIKASMSQFPSYQQMSSRINEILRSYPGIYYASGHVHALQYFYTKDNIHYIISGAGSKENKLNAREIQKYNTEEEKNEYLLWNSGGFFEVDFNKESTETYLYYNEASIKCKID